MQKVLNHRMAYSGFVAQTKERTFFQVDLKVSELANYKILGHVSQNGFLCEEC